jgi:hypothetical protein
MKRLPMRVLALVMLSSLCALLSGGFVSRAQAKKAFSPELFAVNVQFEQVAFEKQGFSVRIPVGWSHRQGNDFGRQLPRDTVSFGANRYSYDVSIVSVGLADDFPRDAQALALTILGKFRRLAGPSELSFTQSRLAHGISARLVFQEPTEDASQSVTVLSEFTVADGVGYWISTEYYTSSKGNATARPNDTQRLAVFEEMVASFIPTGAARLEIELSQSDWAAVLSAVDARDRSRDAETDLTWPSTGYVGFLYDQNGHNGIDIWTTTQCNETSTAKGNPIYAAGEGTLDWLYKIPEGVYDGARIDHQEKSIWTHYWHLGSLAPGGIQTSFIVGGIGSVNPGSLIGYQGNLMRNGNEGLVQTTCIHLHLTVTDGPADLQAIDPSPYLGIKLNWNDPGHIGWHNYIERPRSANVDVVLIIDSSGSMWDNDPEGKRLDAGKAYLTASLSGDYVGVVDFDDSVRFASPLQRLPENKDALIAAINTINSSGGTNIGMGVEAGCGVLQGITTPNYTKGAILLTDGDGYYNNQAQCFIDHGWPIYAFGFGSANDTLLEQIATSTGGEYKRLPTSNLVCEFQSVRTKIAGGQPSPCTAQVVKPNETVQFPVNLLERLLKVTFSISWPGSDVELSLMSPSGRVIDRNTTEPDVEHDLGATYESYGITNPELGEWQVRLFGAEVPDGGEEVVFNYATILDPSPEPDPPLDFTASDGTLIAQVDLTWIQSEGTTYYEIYRAIPGIGNWEFMHTRDGLYDFSSDGLNIDGTVLEYAAKACSDAGCSELSNSDTGYADMPTLQSIENADGDGNYDVSWIPANSASHHELQESHNGGVWTEIYSGNETSISLTDTTNGQWCYRVRGYNGIQYYSPWTPVRCTTVFEGSPPVNELHLPVILNSTGFNQPPPLSFIYPQNGQVLNYGGHYLFKVTPYPNAEGYLWGFFQNGQYVWENMTEEGNLDGPEYAILSGTEAHNRFRRGSVDVWVRASINNGNWTEPMIITIFLE